MVDNKIEEEKKRKEKESYVRKKKSYISFISFCSQMLTKDKCPYILSVRLHSHDRIYHHHRRVVERKKKKKRCITNESICVHDSH